MNKELLNIKVQEFIKKFTGDIATIAFSGSPFADISTQELIQQIESRSKAAAKLPKWFHTSGIIFPPKLNLEQTSSEETAKYKSELLTGKALADITGGFGIDSFYFSKQFEHVYHFELNSELSEIAAHNFKKLGATNISSAAEDGLQYVLQHTVDVIYADPSRRHDTKGKVFFLKDCEPNIPEYLDSLFAHCSVLLLKTSPMLDISMGLQELRHVFEIHVVAINNEVKELLWLLRSDFNGEPKIITVNLTKDAQQRFDFEWDRPVQATYSHPKEFLYEPNAALLKSGAFQQISATLKLDKLHQHSHLYTSDALLDFPGRRFRIVQMVAYGKREMRSLAPIDKANITTRNFPESVAGLRKKWKIKDGGESYLFFTTLMDEKRWVLVCEKV